jgi:hypothetical protein
MLIDAAVSGDRNVIKKEAEKILKYKDFTTETQRMWNVKTKVIPAIIQTTEPSHNHPQNTSATYRQSTTSSNYRQQPYWALHTYSGKYWCKVQNIERGE